MIQVTLSFPDKAAMLAYFADSGSPLTPYGLAMQEKASAGLVKTDQAATKKIADPKSVPTEATPPAATTAQVASSFAPSESVDYPTLQKAVFALAGKSREAAGAVAASLGVKTFKELPEAKWTEALDVVKAKLAELEAE